MPDKKLIELFSGYEELIPKEIEDGRVLKLTYFELDNSLEVNAVYENVISADNKEMFERRVANAIRLKTLTLTPTSTPALLPPAAHPICLMQR